jgi:hypothetical protein
MSFHRTGRPARQNPRSSKETLGSHISTISNSNVPIFSDRTDRSEPRSNSYIP